MKKLIYIEDNQDVRESTQEILELADYEVSTAENGKLGVELAKKIQPDLIICDIMMPGIDGYGVLGILSKNPATSNIPFIFLTAKSDKSDVRKGMNLGADDYVTKPFEEAELLDAIETRLKRSEKMKKEFSQNIDGLNEFINEARGLEGLKDLSTDRKIKEYRQKEVIYREDDYSNYLYFIIEGKVKCLKTDNYGKDLVTDLYGPGDFIGYTTLFEGAEYNETAITMQPTKVAVIPKEDFMKLVHKNRDVSAAFIKILSGNLQDKERRLLQLAYASVRERLAAVLLDLQEKGHMMQGSDERMKISRENLASIVGTAKESLIRTLSELKKENLVDTDGQEIRILDIEGLKKVASGFY
jgi:DNA-binding response OmpR family regulator